VLIINIEELSNRDVLIGYRLDFFNPYQELQNSDQFLLEMAK